MAGAGVGRTTGAVVATAGSGWWAGKGRDVGHGGGDDRQQPGPRWRRWPELATDNRWPATAGCDDDRRRYLLPPSKLKDHGKFNNLPLYSLPLLQMPSFSLPLIICNSLCEQTNFLSLCIQSVPCHLPHQHFATSHYHIIILFILLSPHISPIHPVVGCYRAWPTGAGHGDRGGGGLRGRQGGGDRGDGGLQGWQRWAMGIGAADACGDGDGGVRRWWEATSGGMSWREIGREEEEEEEDDDVAKTLMWQCDMSLTGYKVAKN
ncbi:hypothetical protein GUJ93_ZPchr0004g39774 [Zizania palustris]|uniref:Uncharacterized protein n=1 Tax=Zizania palustris TaxID=103762 RepID=A0A8J5SS16_ZIZPA|nr:hypothetical protein GUJ93_ZPchr0004g39774 [Zizania palustris]